MIVAISACTNTKVGVMLLWIIVVAGCTSVPLRHPETGEMVKCGPYLGDPSSDHEARILKRWCIKEYERKGYARLME